MWAFILYNDIGDNNDRMSHPWHMEAYMRSTRLHSSENKPSNMTSLLSLQKRQNVSCTECLMQRLLMKNTSSFNIRCTFISKVRYEFQLLQNISKKFILLDINIYEL